MRTPIRFGFFFGVLAAAILCLGHPLQAQVPELKDLKLPETPKFEKSDDAEVRFNALRTLRTQIILQTPQLKAEGDRWNSKLSALRQEQSDLQQKFQSSTSRTSSRKQSINSTINNFKADISSITKQLEGAKSPEIRNSLNQRLDSYQRSLASAESFLASLNAEEAEEAQERSKLQERLSQIAGEIK